VPLNGIQMCFEHNVTLPCHSVFVNVLGLWGSYQWTR